MTYYPFATEIGARYDLTSATGDKAIFNDPTDPNYVGMLTEVTGLDSADVRESAEDLTESDGGVHGNFYFSRRAINLNGRIFGHASVGERNIRMDRARRASMALRPPAGFVASATPPEATLTWKPSLSYRRDNFVTNPRAVTNTTGWVTSGAGTGLNTGATLTRLTGQAPPVGTTAFQIVTSGATNTNQGAAFPVSVVAGQTYTVSIAAKQSAGTGTVNPYVFANNAVTTFGTIPAGWTTFNYTFTALVTETADFGVISPNSNTAAATVQFSDVMVTEGTNATYFDGDTAGYWWKGSSSGSISQNYIEMFTTVRRQARFQESGGWVKEFQIPLVSEYATVFSTDLHSATGGSLENKGNYPAFPILQITGPSTNPQVTADIPSAYGTDPILKMALTMTTGSTIEVDTLNHTAKYTAGPNNGLSANQYVDWANTGWPYLPPGNTTVSLSGGGSLNVLWRDTWA